MSISSCLRQSRVQAIRLMFPLLLLGFAASGQDDSAKQVQQLESQLNQFASAGKFDEALKVARELVKLREAGKGAEHPDTASALNTLAALLTRTGNYEAAEPVSRRSLAIAEKLFGPQDARVAAALNNLATLLLYQGQPHKAEPLLRRCLEIKETTFGLENPQLVNALNNLAGVYQDMGNASQAEPLLLRSLRIAEQSSGPDTEAAAMGLQNLATLYQERGDFLRAEPLLERSLAILRKLHGSEHPGSAVVLHGLASLNASLGAYSKAEQFSKQELKLTEATLGREHPEVAAALNSLGTIYLQQRAYPKAAPLLQRALDIRLKALGPEHPDTVTSINNLAVLHYRSEEFSAAQTLLERALKSSETSLGEGHPLTATSLNCLATVLARLGQSAQAEALYLRSLTICDRLLSYGHVTATDALAGLTALNIDLGRRDAALAYARDHQRRLDALRGNILAFTSERQRLAYQESQHPCDLLGSLGSAIELAEVLMRNKGIVLESLAADHLAALTSRDPQQKRLTDELHRAGRRLTQIQTELPNDPRPDSLKRLKVEEAELVQQVETLQKSLAQNASSAGVVRSATRVKVADLQAVLPHESVLLEFARYEHYLGKGLFEARYGVILVSGSKVAIKGAKAGVPVWIPLGAAKPIDESIAAYATAMRKGRTGGETVLRQLGGQLFDPIQARLPGEARSLIVSPDSQLNFLNFGTLVCQDGKFLAEQLIVKYVATGRDLLADGAPKQLQGQMVAFANPSYSERLSASSNATGRGQQGLIPVTDRRGYDGLTLSPLPGTEQEVAFLKANAQKWRLTQQDFLGVAATEAQINSVRSPAILHLATHGFFLSEPASTGRSLSLPSVSEEAGNRVLRNPLLRSGLALAGAQTTLEAWKRGEVPLTENDGILTAQEVGALDLNGTWLVVLSACDTGLGELRNGEGVLGLRRGFVQAGAQNLLMTLWPISDKWSVDIMKAFYEKAMASGDAAQAMADVQAEWLGRLRKEKGVLIAARIAGPFVLSTRGRQSSK